MAKKIKEKDKRKMVREVDSRERGSMNKLYGGWTQGTKKCGK